MKTLAAALRIRHVGTLFSLPVHGQLAAVEPPKFQIEIQTAGSYDSTSCGLPRKR